MHKLTDIEKRLIRNIMEDPDAGTGKLAERVGMSTTACWRKIEKFQELGNNSRLHCRCELEKVRL